MAEKVETILRRSVFNTRPRDFYDAYILCTTQRFDKLLFREALKATSAHRGTSEQIADVTVLLKTLSDSTVMQNMWDGYRKQFVYAQDITYEMVIATLSDILS